MARRGHGDGRAQQYGGGARAPGEGDAHRVGRQVDRADDRERGQDGGDQRGGRDGAEAWVVRRRGWARS